jgi:enhancing lycopene biosynthesis protein 2
MKPVAVILSGSGRADGSEIHESVCTLLALSLHGLLTKIFAPDIEQFRVVNHLSGKMTDESRNVLIESARIARGDISPLSALRTEDVSAIIFPGGLGAASNLCTYVRDGIKCSVESTAEKILSKAMKERIPLGFICIAPVLGAKIAEKLGKNILLTIGDDPDTAGDIEAMGCRHRISKVHEAVVDKENHIVSTAAYMSAKNIAECYSGIGKLVEAIKELMN